MELTRSLSPFSLVEEMAVTPSKIRKIRHFQGFKRGNFALFFTNVFTLNSGPIGQTLGMAGLLGVALGCPLALARVRSQ